MPFSRPGATDIPELSKSVDSAVSVEEEEHTTERSISSRKIQSLTADRSEDSALSRSRGKEKHITPLGLEKMVFSIKEKTILEPLSPTIQANLPPIADITPRPSSPLRQPLEDQEQPSNLQNSSDSGFSVASVNTPPSGPPSDHRGSDTSVSSGGLIKSGSVVHGFSPSQVSSSFRERSRLGREMSIPNPTALSNKIEIPKKTGIFTLGGSSGDDESSFEDHVVIRPKQSSLSASFKKPSENHKVPSFKDIVQSRQIKTIREGYDEDEDAIESDEDEDASDSAIEDSAIDDEGDWEDSVSESGKSSDQDKTLFQRVDSRANLVSRRSMLTTLMHEPQRAAALANAASKSSPVIRRSRTSSPNGPSLPASPDEHETALTMRRPDMARPKPIIYTTSNTHAPAHSPRTTRRNMLATELTESLRKHLLWERQQKSTTANAVFKRRHTAQNMANLQEYPGAKPGQIARDASKNHSWNHYFDAPWEYHTKGW